jgi:hypothetical protein
MSGTARLIVPLTLIVAAFIVWLIWGPCPDELRMPIGTAAGIVLLALFAAMQTYIESYFGTWMDPLIILVFTAMAVILFLFSPVMGVIGVLLLIALIFMMGGRY